MIYEAQILLQRHFPFKKTRSCDWNKRRTHFGLRAALVHGEHGVLTTWLSYIHENRRRKSLTKRLSPKYLEVKFIYIVFLPTS